MPPAVAASSGTSSTGGAAGRREDATHTRLIANASDASTLWTSLATDGSSAVTLTAAEAAEAVRRRRRALPSGPDAIGNALTRRLIRDLIRYLYLVLDMSSAALQPPDHLTGSGSAAPTAKTRHAVLLATAIAYVREYYDQNPISHLGIVLLKDGQAQLVSPLGGSPGAHLGALQGPALGPGSCGGNASLMNGLECAGRSLSAAPAHGSREVLVLTCSLRSDDPGDLMGAAEGAASIGVRVSAVGLAGAEVYAVRRICEITGGSYAVASDGGHLRRLVRGHCVPPISVVSDNEKESDDGDNHDKQNHNRRQNGSTNKRKGKRSCAYVKMGFPTRETTAVAVEGKNGSEGTDVAVPTLVHSGGDRKIFSRTGYACPQCKAKVLELPTDCPVCGLKLVLAPHLARSFHHLFPVPAFVEVEDAAAPDAASSLSAPEEVLSGVGKKPRKVDAVPKLPPSILVSSSDPPDDTCCTGCLRAFLSKRQEVTYEREKVIRPKSKGSRRTKISSEVIRKVNEVVDRLPRFRCPECNNFFCAECDAYLHDALHNCPGCLRRVSNSG